ncbi:hypothetical protein [Streptomyces sp. NPDC020983]|uniref:hypothetical protein n=1 Tax=Streptomyces sp. NPDC020983 TaxID=3365106 RepID=UPI00378FFE21
MTMPLHPKKCVSIECDVDGRCLQDDDGAEFRLDGLEEAVIVARSYGWSVLAGGTVVLCDTRDAAHQAGFDALLPTLQITGQVAIDGEVSP